MRKALLIALISIALALPAWAADEVTVSAGAMEMRDGVYHLANSVTITMRDYTLNADRATYDRQSGKVEAEGNVRMVNNKGAAMDADRAEFEVSGEKGMLTNARIRVEPEGYRMDSRLVRIDGRNIFRLADSAFTTCKGIPPDWCVKGSTVTVEPGESVSAWNATFNIHNVPVFYTPYFWAPIIRERRTGLLVPSFGYTSKGNFMYRQPLFIALSDRRDLTVTLDIHSLRYFGQSLEYNYAESAFTNGTFHLYHLGLYEGGGDYYELTGAHRTFAPLYSFTAKADWNNDTARYYAYDVFTDNVRERYAESSAEALVRFTKSGNSSLAIYARHRIDLINGPDPGAIDNSVAHIAPTVELYIAPLRRGPVGVSALAETAVLRAEREGEEAMRSTLWARQTAGGTLGPLVLEQEARAEERFYSGLWNGSSRAERFDLRGQAKVVAYRDYGGLTHTVEPGVRYEYRAVFGNSPAFITNATALYDQREMEQEGLSTLAPFIVTRLYDSGGGSAALRVEQPLDMDSGSCEGRLMPFLADLGISWPSALYNGTFTADTAVTYDHEAEAIGIWVTRAGWAGRRLDIALGRSYERSLDIHNYSGLAGYRVSDRWRVEGEGRYDVPESAHWQLIRAGLGYEAECWGVKVNFRREPGEYSATLNVTLAGL